MNNLNSNHLNVKHQSLNLHSNKVLHYLKKTESNGLFMKTLVLKSKENLDNLVTIYLISVRVKYDTDFYMLHRYPI